MSSKQLLMQLPVLFCVVLQRLKQLLHCTASATPSILSLSPLAPSPPPPTPPHTPENTHHAPPLAPLQVHWYTALIAVTPQQPNVDAFAGMAVGATIGGIVVSVAGQRGLGDG